MQTQECTLKKFKNVSLEKSDDCSLRVNSPENGSEHDYDDVLDMIGFGKAQWIILLTTGLMLMMVINETMGMSIITIVSQCDFETNSMDKALMSAASFIGIFTSSYLWGCLSDTIGRRPVLMYTTFAGNVVSLISMFTTNYALFIILRFLVGFFIAGASSTTYAYLGEFFVARHRPIVINYASMFVGISTLYVPAVAFIVLSRDWSLNIGNSFQFRSWRLIIFFYLLPGLLAVLVMLKLPESPKMLIVLRKDKEMYASVNWIAKCNTGKHLNDLKVAKIKNSNGVTNLSDNNGILSRMWKDTRLLFTRPYLVNFIISCTVMCGLFFSSSGLGLWFPEIQNRLGSNDIEDVTSVCDLIDNHIDVKSQNVTSNICNDHITNKSYIDTVTYGASLIIGYVLLGIVINPFGRKVVMVGSLIIAAACALALLWVSDPVITVACFCLYLILPGLCVSVLSGAVVDLVPTQLRGKALCICLMFGRSGSVFGSNIVGVLLESYCTATFGIFSGFVFVCALLTMLLPI